jgi:hypothetical protein
MLRRMRMAQALAGFVLLVGITAAIAQDDRPMATVYVYRAQTWQFKKYRPPVSCDGLEAAWLPGSSYLALSLPAGKHVLHSSDHKNSVALDLVAGEKRYVRLEVNKWGFALSAKLVEVPLATGEHETAGLALAPSLVPSAALQ